MDYLSDRARREADIREREGERMEGGIPLVLDGVLESMVLESVHLLVLGSGPSLLWRGRERVFHHQYFGKYVYHSDNCPYSLDGERRMQG